MSETALPALGVGDIIAALDGVTNTQVDTAGTTQPLIRCIVAGVLRGAVVMLGTDSSAQKDPEEIVDLMKKLLVNDEIILAIGYPVKVAMDAGLLDKSAKDLCSDGLKRVCELADIPPVLPLGGLENIQNVVTIAGALSKDSGLAIPQLPVVGCDPAGVAAEDVELGNTFVGLGVDTFIGLLSADAPAEELKAAAGLKDGPEAKHTVASDLQLLADAIIADIEDKREALGI